MRKPQHPDKAARYWYSGKHLRKFGKRLVNSVNRMRAKQMVNKEIKTEERE